MTNQANGPQAPQVLFARGLNLHMIDTMRKKKALQTQSKTLLIAHWQYKAHKFSHQVTVV